MNQSQQNEAKEKQGSMNYKNSNFIKASSFLLMSSFLFLSACNQPNSNTATSKGKTEAASTPTLDPYAAQELDAKAQQTAADIANQDPVKQAQAQAILAGIQNDKTAAEQAATEEANRHAEALSQQQTDLATAQLNADSAKDQFNQQQSQSQLEGLAKIVEAGGKMTGDILGGWSKVKQADAANTNADANAAYRTAQADQMSKSGETEQFTAIKDAESQQYQNETDRIEALNKQNSDQLRATIAEAQMQMDKNERKLAEIDQSIQKLDQQETAFTAATTGDIEGVDTLNNIIRNSGGLLSADDFKKTNVNRQVTDSEGKVHTVNVDTYSLKDPDSVSIPDFDSQKSSLIQQRNILENQNDNLNFTVQTGQKIQGNRGDSGDSSSSENPNPEGNKVSKVDDSFVCTGTTNTSGCPIKDLPSDVVGVSNDLSKNLDDYKNKLQEAREFRDLIDSNVLYQTAENADRYNNLVLEAEALKSKIKTNLDSLTELRGRLLVSTDTSLDEVKKLNTLNFIAGIVNKSTEIQNALANGSDLQGSDQIIRALNSSSYSELAKNYELFDIKLQVPLSYSDLDSETGSSLAANSGYLNQGLEDRGITAVSCLVGQYCEEQK